MLSFEGVLRKRLLRWVPAVDLDSVLDIALSLNSEGIIPTLNRLGERTAQKCDVQRNIDECLSLARAGIGRSANFSISVKPSQLGGLIGPSLLKQNVVTLLREVQESDVRLFVDAEDESITDLSWSALKGLVSAEANLVLTVQANHSAALSHLSEVSSLGGRARLCKGGYRSPSGYASFEELVLEALRVFPPSRLVLATNSPRVVRLVFANSGDGRPEIETLQGIHGSAERVAKELGLQLRRYVPYGGSWIEYCKRRDPWFVENEKRIIGYFHP